MSPRPESRSDAAFVVPADMHGMRGEDALQRMLPGVHRKALRRIVRDGLVLLNGSELRPFRKVREGDLLALSGDLEPEELPRFDGPSRVERPEVLYEDEACLVLDKPAGLSTVPERHGEDSLYRRFDEWFGAGADLRIVHRLDRGTSGVLVLAKGAGAARSFDEQFRARTVEKRYLALVRGSPRSDALVCDAPIGRTIRGGRVRVGDAKGAREARTEFLVEKRYRGFALLTALPLTWRMHQIRAHLGALRLPLAVDPLYGGARELRLSEIKPDYRARRGRDERPLISRLTLHAAVLRFVSPSGDVPVEAAAPLPKDLRVVLAKMDRWAALPAGDDDE